jgi:hypothetical protein
MTRVHVPAEYRVRCLNTPAHGSCRFSIAGRRTSQPLPGLTLLRQSSLIRPLTNSSLQVSPASCFEFPVMTSRFHSHSTSKHRWQSSAICGLVLVCLVGQSVLPGIPISPLPTTGHGSETAGCCVIDLSMSTRPGCCCGPATGKSCGCACGTKKSSTPTVAQRDKRSSSSGKSIESEICGCGGEHRLGMITSIDPAVLSPIEELLRVRPQSHIPDVKLAHCGWTLPPPTPPPECCA